MEVIDIDITARYKSEDGDIAKTKTALDKVAQAEKTAGKEADNLAKKTKLAGVAAGNAFTKGISSAKKFGSSIGKAFISGISDVKKLESSIGKAGSALEIFGGKADRLSNKLHSIGSKTITIPVKIADYATAPLRSMISYATSLKGIMTGIATGYATNKLLLEPVSAADAIESSRIFFETKLGGTDAANAMIARIQEFDKKSPFNSTEIIGITQKMLAMGFQADGVIDKLGIIGDTSAALGQGTVGVEGISKALGDMRLKGAIQGQELIQLTNWGVGGKEYVMRAFGKSYEEVNKDIEAGLLTIDDAINGILTEMEKDYGGAAAANADRTVSGIMGQLQSLVETKIELPWGEGLAAGFKDGLIALNELLDVNEEGLDKIGDKLRKFGSELSTGFVGIIERGYNRLSSVMDSQEFEQADMSGKIGIVWGEVFAEPFGAWWDSTGSAWATSAAEKMGAAFAVGIKTAFIAAFKELPKDALTMIPGDDTPTSGTAGLSALIMGGLALKGGSMLGKFGSFVKGGSILGTAGAAASTAGYTSTALGLLGIKLGSQAATTAGLVSAGTSGVFGGLAGLAGLLSGFRDLLVGKKWQGGTKIGMVGAGAAAGAAAGSFIPVVGTGIGALIGAGVGGVGALFKGSDFGDWLEDVFGGAGDAAKASDEQMLRMAYSARIAADSLDTLANRSSNAQITPLQISNGYLRGASNRGRGYAGGTNSATRGWHMVGELGPELMYFHGGERVMNASQTKQAAGGVHIEMGGVHVTVTGGADLQGNIEPIANELSNVIAEKLTRIFENKTVTA